MSGRRPEHGQNFLRSRRLARRLLANTSLSADDLVLDIGAGTGVLTAQLSQRCRHVVAYEVDPNVFRGLERRFRDSANVTLVHADFLTCALPRGPYKVCANLPFNITADVVAKLTSGVDPPQDAYLVVQREAVQRFIPDRRRRYTLVACLLYPRWHAQVLAHIPATAFRPAPAVDAAQLHLRLRSRPLIAARHDALFRNLVTQGYVGGTCLGRALRPLLTTRQLRRIASDLGLGLDQSPSHVRPQQWVDLLRFVLAHQHQVNLSSICRSHARLQRRQRRLRKSHRTRSPRR
ncbi:MAG: rRNA adenine N(6)-methyltransferase family protein [Chloroflexota bacterium]|nr:rRNA adenine N(6)-methyltransferase family protein [Chloroflexota bacterium]MDE2919473.1 rRNA adenine N(6)-methyltransferase family protein [Chloroflexota bacterium]